MPRTPKPPRAPAASGPAAERSAAAWRSLRDAVKHAADRAGLMRRIEEAMERHEISQAELARRLDVPQSSVSTWWRTRAWPGGERLSQLPLALEVDGGWLLTGAGGMYDHRAEGGDPEAYAAAFRKGALWAIAQLRGDLNRAEEQVRAMSPRDLLALAGEAPKPPKSK